MRTNLPTFLVIGAYKCGSTSLYHYLKQHPQIFMPRGKELLYWSYVANPDPEHPASRRSVREFSAYKQYFEEVGDELAIGEVSPEYLAQAQVTAPEILRALPDVRLIAILRDPVDRAWSDYLMYRLDGRETKAFETALQEQAERRKRGDPTGYYVETGFYGRQLAPYYDLFPSENILVVLQEDMARSPEHVMKRVFRFVGVDDAFRPEFRRYLAARFPRFPLADLAARAGRKLGFDVSWLYYRPTIPEPVARQLQRVFAEDVVRLARTTGVDLTPWPTWRRLTE